ncbi:growth/differentiation factor 8 [Cimex lectularius]|uniref:TGF-beta family profile domain-containing protein n=1 Tax=Cimex lectularius TaxID=79782 RepID=A0A8I6RX51_CIMLE|nr:growth/differentiation factor 8 [Cimex lectularius]XP_024082636.1 growth/differentiation factor 8 [Cimex lectularius]
MTLLGYSLLLVGCLVGAVESAGTCSACLLRTELRSISLANIKEQILAKLGFSAAPNITGRQIPRIPPLEYIMDVYSMQGDQPQSFKPGPALLEEQDDYSASMEKVIAFAQPHPKLRHWRGQEMLFFKFSDKMLDNKVVRAKLWLYLRPGETVENSSVTITVLRMLRTSSNSDMPTLNTLTSTREARPIRTGRWVSIDVKKLVVEWFKNPKENMGLGVHAAIPLKDSLHTQHLIALSSQYEGSSYVPFLEVHITDTRKHRTKRTIGLNCPENSDEKRCCRYPLTVDFEEFGWDWIIAPKKYEANYCSGECPLVFLPKYPHTHIIHIANPTGTPGPCCAPRKMSSISMLYFDQEFNIIYGLLPGMVVDRCGCA